MATAKKERPATARKRPSKPKPPATPAAAAAPPAAAPVRPWYEHPLVSPVVWTVIAGTLTVIWAYGQDFYRDFRDQVVMAPEPFAGDGVGILLARLKNDPDNEFSSRVRAALERQFPMGSDGRASINVNLYPKALELPEYGDHFKNVAQANAEGREWLKEQKADLLIWGSALPTAQMLELRILTREAPMSLETEQPREYPIVIPSKFSEQIGTALAGMVAGAGANAWSQRGGYLTPSRAQDLYDWMARLRTLQDELPDSLDEDTRNQFQRKIRLARAQLGGALLADGNSSLAPQVMNDLFPGQDDKQDESILATHPFMAAEIVGDVVTQFSTVLTQMGPDDANQLLSLIELNSQTFDDRHADGKLGRVEHAYLSGLLAKLNGDVEAFLGKRDKAKESYAEAVKDFEMVLAELPPTHDALSRARVQDYLGESQLALAHQSAPDEAAALLDSSISNFTEALGAVSAETAPRNAVLFRYHLASAEVARATWYMDVGALKRAIQHLETVVPVLASNQRDSQAAGVTVQAADLLFSDAVLDSGTAGAEEGLALLDGIGSPAERRTSNTEACKALPGDDRTACLQQQKTVALQEEAALQRGACMGHLAAGDRFDRKADRLSAPALEHMEVGLKACEAAAEAMQKIGNIAGFAEMQLYVSVGRRVVGERTKDADMLRSAIAAADRAKDQLARINIPSLTAQAALARAAALRELGVLEGKPDLLTEAEQLQLSALPVYSGKDFVTQRLYANTQLAQTLVHLAELEKADDKLDEASELLTHAQKLYADGGAKLRAADAARELRNLDEIRAKLNAN